MNKLSIKRILDNNLLNYRMLMIQTNADIFYISIPDIVGKIDYWEDYFVINVEPSSISDNVNVCFISYDKVNMIRFAGKGGE